jgi:hypothetical protein
MAMWTISTAIPGPEYQPLLDAVHAAADICANPPRQPPEEDDGSVGAFGLVVLSRWAANVQAFILLRNANLLADAYAVARVASELAIMSAWAECGVSDRFTTPAARVKALINDGTYSTRVWFDKMHERYASTPRRYDDTTAWGRALIAAKNPKLPTLEQMADCSDVTKDQYAFAYRGESGSVHSAARVLAANAAGQPPIADRLMLHNVLVAALIVFGAVSNVIEDERAASMARRLQQAIRDRVPTGKPKPT